ncbi:sensor domain-containing diguanylate cyclase [Paracraurococcus lichenis]|uniref:diguanylate cyclase n=1 Tax=Paracraurococcus lichenis TaxID=3064888 RepID=A0ABT9DTT1_9PROT|nr:sensor domain-containing diguanylate cyclase [Paracraurococcus sp. LOR1-02]MDO9707312.1 diguanylate cyclase [Paracraurococcus sp. LOR1-02]
MSVPGLSVDACVTESLLAALSASGQAVALYDEADRLRYANDAYRQIFLGGRTGEVTFAELLRHGAAHGLGTQIRGDVEALIARTYERRRTSPRKAFETDLIDGRWLWMEEVSLPNGWVLTVGSDITSLKLSERTLRRAHDEALAAALTDALTGLPNRRHILALLDEALAEAGRDAAPLCLALLDLDRFKGINDAHGHEGGDAVLRHFGRTCRERLRRGDHLGRLGGEEFLALIPHAGLRDAFGAVTRFREGFPAVELAAGETPLRYTFSVGLAEAAPGEDGASVLQRADRALYAAKAAGRDCVRIGLRPADRQRCLGDWPDLAALAA